MWSVSLLNKTLLGVKSQGLQPARGLGVRRLAFYMLSKWHRAEAEVEAGKETSDRFTVQWNVFELWLILKLSAKKTWA